jgi:hypothetical protein
MRKKCKIEWIIKREKEENEIYKEEIMDEEQETGKKAAETSTNYAVLSSEHRMLFCWGRSALINALHSYNTRYKQLINYNYVRNESIIVS